MKEVTVPSNLFPPIGKVTPLSYGDGAGNGALG